MDRPFRERVPEAPEFVHGPDETPVYHMAVISDPDGNSIIIHRRKG